MNIAHQHKAPETGDAQGRAGAGFADLRLPGDLRQIDWSALRQRLFAARDVVGVSGEDAAPKLHLRGSFHGCAASTLTTYQESSRFVNLDGSSNGKPADGNNPPVAEANEIGERGQR
ncbi:MAG TPA: hypothetical protein VMQ93_12865 [Novosphingobium sp.]|nr:hypothetical protein [Novosphingobium sp.]